MEFETCNEFYNKENRNTCGISILLPVYNAGKFLDETLKSLILQNFDDFEIICIDDCSKDNSYEILEEFHKNYPEKIVLLKNETNLGIVGSLNKGIDKASGKYIARMDADDICLQGRLKKQFLYMEQHPEIGICGCQIYKFGALNRKVYLPCSPEDVKATLLFNCCLIHPSVVMRAEVIKKNNIRYSTDFEYAEDFEFWTRAMEFCEIANLKERLLKYRVHSDSISSSRSAKQKELERNIKKKQMKKYFSQLSIEETDLISGFEQLDETNVSKLYDVCQKIIDINNKTSDFNNRALKKALYKYTGKLLRNKFIEDSNFVYLKEIFKYSFFNGISCAISKFSKILRKK